MTPYLTKWSHKKECIAFVNLQNNCCLDFTGHCVSQNNNVVGITSSCYSHHLHQEGI